MPLNRKSCNAIRLSPFWNRTMASRNTTTCVLAVLLLAVCPQASTQTASSAPAINALVTSYVSDHHVPGLSVAVIDRGHVIFTQGYGLADVENSVAATADTVYRIASFIQIHHCDGCDEAGRRGKAGPRCPHPGILSRLSQEGMADHDQRTSPTRAESAITRTKKKLLIASTIRVSSKH